MQVRTPWCLCHDVGLVEGGRKRGREGGEGGEEGYDGLCRWRVKFGLGCR